MIRIVRLVVVTVITLSASVGYGQETPQRVLIPVQTTEPIPGVNGSSWTTDLWVSNGGASIVNVFGVAWDCLLPECGLSPAPVDPGRSFQPVLLGEEGALHGQILYVGPEGADRLGFGLRFRDLSRQAETWGTEIPVPRETAFHSSAFSLVDVPVTEGFRQTLRVYEIDGTPREVSVRVRVFRLDPSGNQPVGAADTLLGETTVPLSFAPLFGTQPLHPGYAEVTDLSTLAPLGDAERLRLEIEPATDGLALWAFVTVIHDETQHATVITPQ